MGAERCLSDPIRVSCWSDEHRVWTFPRIDKATLVPYASPGRARIPRRFSRHYDTQDDADSLTAKIKCDTVLTTTATQPEPNALPSGPPDTRRRDTRHGRQPRGSRLPSSREPRYISSGPESDGNTRHKTPRDTRRGRRCITTILEYAQHRSERKYMRSPTQRGTHATLHRRLTGIRGKRPRSCAPRTSGRSRCSRVPYSQGCEHLTESSHSPLLASI